MVKRGKCAVWSVWRNRTIWQVLVLVFWSLEVEVLDILGAKELR